MKKKVKKKILKSVKTQKKSFSASLREMDTESYFLISKEIKKLHFNPDRAFFKLHFFFLRT